MFVFDLTFRRVQILGSTPKLEAVFMQQTVCQGEDFRRTEGGAKQKSAARK